MQTLVFMSVMVFERSREFFASSHHFYKAKNEENAVVRKIGDNELKIIELEILQQFHEICENEGFHYSLIAGTLLGAVRHKGFIPWDDDIDVSMPRPDYNRFIKYCMENDTPFVLLAHENNPNYKKLFSKIYDKRTKIINEFENRWGYDCGVHLDIFPIDALGNSKDEAIGKMKRIKFIFELYVASQWKFYSKSKTHRWYLEPVRFAFFALSRITNTDKLIAKIEKSTIKDDFEECKYVAAVCGSYRFKEIIPKGVYSNFELIEFENKKYYAICDYMTYLRNVYGDYMQLPPISKRISHHSFEAYWRDENHA